MFRKTEEQIPHGTGDFKLFWAQCKFPDTLFIKPPDPFQGQPCLCQLTYKGNKVPPVGTILSFLC